MGAPYWGQHFESAELSQALRHWWNEPNLIASISAARRQRHLRAWLASRLRQSKLAGAKHPLLSLCGDDLCQAWGNEVRFIWCQRPLSASIASLEKMGWWPDAERIQRKLQAANSDFFQHRTFISVDFDALQTTPREQIERLIDSLELQPEAAQMAAAIAWIEDWSQPSQLNPEPPDIPPTATVERAADKCPTKIVATMLSGNAQTIAAAAVESVIDWVDELCLIDTGIDDRTIERVATIAKEKLSLVSFGWCNDFAAARNAALAAAAERGATWALTIDTDERLSFPAYATISELRRALNSQPSVQAWSVAVKHGSYSKERFIRLPTTLQWRGRTHETLTTDRRYFRRKLEGCHFWETGKSHAEQQHKLKRDLDILLEETAAQPLNARWWYYLGQTYEGLKEFHRAVEAFDHCIRLDGWPDESAWACYTAARCLVALHEYRDAEEYCGLGLSRKPSTPELPWLAGWCCFQRGALQCAVTWCKLAIVLGRDTHPDNATVFRHVPAWYEAPYDVLRHVFRQLGNVQDAENAEQDFQAAKAQRLFLFPSSI